MTSSPVPETAMTRIPVMLAVALAASGCAASGDAQVAAADCRVVPITTAGATGRAPRTLSPIEQRAAEMDLARTEYRQRQLRERGIHDNPVEDALRDCDRR
jgi:hypothetical protein